MARPIQSTLASDPEGPTYTAISYDSSDRTRTITNPYRTTSDSTYGATTLSYDALGRPTVVTDPDNSTVKLYYGTSVTAAGGISSQICSPATYGYGYPMLQIDEAGKKRQTWANAFGETIEVDEPNSSGTLSLGTCYTHDALGNLTGVTQQGGTTNSAQWRNRTFVYDGLSRLTSATEPESGTTTYSYDNNGNVLTKNAPAPNQPGSATVTTCFGNWTGTSCDNSKGYDALNRLLLKTYSDGTTPSAQYTWDANSPGGPIPNVNNIGRLATTWSPNYTGSKYNYDAMGRVANSLDCIDVNCNWNSDFSYTYDLAGNLTSYTNKIAYWTNPPVASITFNQSFDTAGRATQLTSSWVDAQHPATLITTDPSIGYFPHGALRKAALGNGLTLTNVYNSRLQPCHIDVNQTNATLQTCNDSTPNGNIQDFWLTYDAGTYDNGNVGHWNASGYQYFTRTFGYDQLNRISTLSQTSGIAMGCGSVYSLSWTYDAWGNRTDQTVTGGSCYPFHATVNTKNQLIDPINNKYQYDAAGNMTQDSNHTYTYDAENRLIKVDGGATARYTYDPLGRRAQKTIGGTTTSYTYDLDGNTFLETQASNWETFYLYFAGRLQAQYKNNLTSFIHQDHLGSTHLVTAMNQSVYDNLDYLPFGEQIAGSSVTTHKFTGYESDSESSLDYASARHFSSTLGRFMQPDPLSGSIGNPQSWNRYAYVYNNPLNTTDPSGMCPPDSEDTSDCPGVGDLSQWDLANWNYEAILGMGGGWNSTDVYNYSDVFANPFAQPWWTNPAAANFPQGGFFDLLWGALGGFANSFGASLSNCGACSPQFQAFVNQQIQPRSNAEEIGMKVGPLVGLFIPGMGEQDAVEEEVVPIFRAVDQRELAFIKEFETYGSSASKSGKYFALTQEGAENFANSQFNAGRNMTITSTAVPRSVFNKGYFFSDPGGGGRSVHFSQDFLPTLYKSMIKIKIHP